MAIVEFSPLAKKDLEDIIVYVAEHNITSAQKIVKELNQKFKLLAENPKLGRVRNSYTIGMRSFPYKNYIIFYFPIKNGVEVYRIIHGARDIDDLFEDFFEGLQP